MARTNFSFKKRQKELERQKKQEEKRQRRLAKKADKLEEPDVVKPDENTSRSASDLNADPDPVQ